MVMALRFRSLAATLADDPPSEFRLFKRGDNETTKGTFKFDAEAAATVMSAYSTHGTDLPIDLEHRSLDDQAVASTTNATDAMGWFELAVRNGELWAVNVRWTADGDARVRGKLQRYISPAFQDDPDGRVVRIVNCALCSLPATHDAQPLAASQSFTAAERAAIYLKRAKSNGS